MLKASICQHGRNDIEIEGENMEELVKNAVPHVLAHMKEREDSIRCLYLYIPDFGCLWASKATNLDGTEFIRWSLTEYDCCELG